MNTAEPRNWTELFEALRDRVLERTVQGDHWEGRLAPSALSTAVGLYALQVTNGGDDSAVTRGRRWLVAKQNVDGGWGDSPRNRSNLSTTLLAWAILGTAQDDSTGEAVARAAAWIEQRTGTTDGHGLAQAVLEHYGADKTFSVPILTVCAHTGLFGTGAEAWRGVPQLPFELSLLPSGLYPVLGLRVVSYALPALIAMGIARRRCGPASVLCAYRDALIGPAMRRLEAIQPDNGGFLEATPLTAFVCISLVAAGLGRGPVAERCRAFLRRSQRQDGSWPIDTNLATWVTTLAANGLRDALPETHRAGVRRWLLSQQFRQIHPYTQARPGGWAWTDLPGGVPDADDTCGALLALRHLDAGEGTPMDRIELGIGWLLGLQNRDGGLPTFCRGWGKLPFDRSCPDITAHALQAWSAWQRDTSPGLRARIACGIRCAVDYLRSSQQPDGTWLPLWFGNEHHTQHLNPVFGTARVLAALNDAGLAIDAPWTAQARAWLLAAQNADGGWGGHTTLPSTVEETSLAVAALARGPNGSAGTADVLERAWPYLQQHALAHDLDAAPIGLYFASLWYYEDLYPLLFALDAARRMHPALRNTPQKLPLP